ncbi:hypothetical protein [Umezawaea sp.]|uniref:hypothetical protein n=1 Tax=Umezawaea sp. TaxID=1955258 RepID=UPI002ED27EB9
MKTIVELLGPPAAGKTTLAGVLNGGMSVVPEQLRALLLEPDPPPPGEERQAAVARRIAAEVAASPEGTVLVDVGWLSLISFACAEWPVERARRVADAVVDAARAAGECRYAGLVVLDAGDEELRGRAAADAPTGRRRGALEDNLARFHREDALLRTAEAFLPPGTVLRPHQSDVDGRAAEVRSWLARGGAGVDPSSLLRRVAGLWTRVTDTSTR